MINKNKKRDGPVFNCAITPGRGMLVGMNVGRSNLSCTEAARLLISSLSETGSGEAGNKGFGRVLATIKRTFYSAFMGVEGNKKRKGGGIDGQRVIQEKAHPGTYYAVKEIKQGFSKDEFDINKDNPSGVN
eukprot:Nk52_evm24s2426 gene=Nk52_evmTU24s2426